MFGKYSTILRNIYFPFSVKRYQMAVNTLENFNRIGTVKFLHETVVDIDFCAESRSPSFAGSVDGWMYQPELINVLPARLNT